MGYKRVSLRVDEWPPADQRYWALANSAGDALEPGGRAAIWKPKTRIQVAKDVGRFLFWLASVGGNFDGVPLSVRVDVELKAYLAHLMQTGMASTSLLSRFRNLRQAIWAIEPDGDIRRISMLCARLKQRAEPVRDKSVRVVSTARLVDAALREYDRLIKSDILTPRTCHRARDALMMLFLAHIPLRLDNFAWLAIGRHIVRNHHGYLLRIDRVDQKDGRDYDVAVPDELIIYLDHYVNRVLPRLLKGRTSDRLWISTRGTGMSASTVYYQICRVTRRLIGHSINPHAFRDCVMTTIAEDAPEKVQAGARLLGHRDLRTSERHYNFATSLAAQRQYHEVLRSLRERTAMSNTRGK